MTRPSRTQPQSVTPRSAASSTASDDGRADRDEHRAAGDGRFLDELEREPPADAEHVVGERQEPLEERPADDLVHRVVAADVLAHAQERRPPRRRARSRAGRRSPRTRAGPRAAAPGSAATTSRRDLERALDPRRARPRPPRSRPSRRRRTTTRCRSAAAAAPDRSRGASTSTVFAARSSGTRAETRRKPLRQAEAERELLVVAGRAHRDGDRLAADADLERLLDGDEVVLVGAPAGAAERVDAARRVRRRLRTCDQRTRGESRGAPRSRRRAQLATAQTANTVIDQFAAVAVTSRTLAR